MRRATHRAQTLRAQGNNEGAGHFLHTLSLCAGVSYNCGHPMPADPFPNLEHFLRGIHRRLTLLRIIERVGVAVAISSALALPVIVLLALRGAEAIAPTVLVLALGFVGGVAWGVSHIPTALEAALEADRQLQWADLLTSAFLIRAAPKDPWQRAVLADADRRCEGLSPSSLFLRRLSSRAWSGIGLAMTIVLTLSAWVGAPADTLARDARSLTASSQAQSRGLSPQPLLAPITLAAQRPSAAPPDGEDAAVDRSVSAPPQRGDGANSPAPADAPARDAAPDYAQGGTLGRTDVVSSPSKPRAEVASGTSHASGGKAAGGNAPPDDAPSAAGKTADGTVAGPAPGGLSTFPGPPPAGSMTSTRPSAISSGEISPADRDLVADYFQRN